jgi:hypothetical protein
LAADPDIKKRAEKIIVRESARLADGESVAENMRLFIGVWNRQRTRGKGRGRPDAWVKETAVCVAWYEKLHKDPRRKREAIVEELANEFGLKRRRIFDILKNAGPRRKSSKCN